MTRIIVLKLTTFYTLKPTSKISQTKFFCCPIRPNIPGASGFYFKPQTIFPDETTRQKPSDRSSV